jgi:hypothetical protein
MAGPFELKKKPEGEAILDEVSKAKPAESQKGGAIFGATIAPIDAAMRSCSMAADRTEKMLGPKIPKDCATEQLLQLAKKANKIQAAEIETRTGVL